MGATMSQSTQRPARHWFALRSPPILQGWEKKMTNASQKHYDIYFGRMGVLTLHGHRRSP